MWLLFFFFFFLRRGSHSVIHALCLVSNFHCWQKSRKLTIFSSLFFLLNHAILLLDHHLLWAPISKDTVLLFFIFNILVTCFDVFLVIRSIRKFKLFVQMHKRLKNSQCSLPKKNAAEIPRNTNDNLSLSARNIANHHNSSSLSHMNEPFMQMSQLGDEDTPEMMPVNSSETIFSSKATKRENDVENNSESHNAKDNDAKPEQKVCSAVDLNHKIVTFSNVFLLVRLQRNLKFLFVVVLLYCLGSGSTAALSLFLYFDNQCEPDFNTLMWIILPGILCPGINALLLCYTTSDLKLAVKSPIRRLFYICRKK